MTNPALSSQHAFFDFESVTVCPGQNANKMGLEGLPSSTRSSVHLQCVAGQRVLAPGCAGDVCRQQPPGAPGAEPPACLWPQPPGGSWGSAPSCWPSAHCKPAQSSERHIQQTPCSLADANIMCKPYRSTLRVTGRQCIVSLSESNARETCF